MILEQPKSKHNSILLQASYKQHILGSFGISSSRAMNATTGYNMSLKAMTVGATAMITGPGASSGLPPTAIKNSKQ
jgi:hypothetical protein